MNNWIIDETKAPDRESIEMGLKKVSTLRNARNSKPALAIRINDLIIHNTRKWFGSADIRIDTLILHGAIDDSTKSFFQPTTFHYPRIKDNERLPIEHPGKLIFYGHPLHFLDISILISKDTKDSDELATLIDRQVNSDEWKDASSTILSVASISPEAELIASAATAAISLANIVFQLVHSATKNTIGLYHTSWLQYRDRFGIGRHPNESISRHQDFSFWYEIVLDRMSK